MNTVYRLYKLRHFLFILSLFFAFILISGCDPSHRGNRVSECEEKHFLRGQQLLKEGRKDEALEAFLKVISNRIDAPESHLEVGYLELDYMHDPISAIYHFRQYLEYTPESDRTRAVKQLIETAQKEFARQLPGSNSFQDSDSGRVDLMKLLKEAREENVQLKKQLMLVRNQLEQYEKKEGVANLSLNTGQPYKTVSGNGIGNGESFLSKQRKNQGPCYVVQTGDTLTKISQKVYGTSSKAMAIFEANKDILSSPNDLKVGQELLVPKE